jgi:hypothetical protein
MLLTSTDEIQELHAIHRLSSKLPEVHATLSPFAKRISNE